MSQMILKFIVEQMILLVII